MLCGYPGAAAYFTRFTEAPTLDSHLIPYTAREIALPAGCDQGFHFALQYEMDRAEPANESKAKLPEPPGFSGAPIWDTRFVASGCSNDWTPGQARMIGVATRWVKENSCIIATRADKLTAFLHELGAALSS